MAGLDRVMQGKVCRGVSVFHFCRLHLFGGRRFLFFHFCAWDKKMPAHGDAGWWGMFISLFLLYKYLWLFPT